VASIVIPLPGPSLEPGIPRNTGFPIAFERRGRQPAKV
jgi:hypothetical protein